MPITILSSNSRWRIVVAAFLTYLLVVVTSVPLTASAQSCLKWLPHRVQQQLTPPHREGELLVRFGAGVSRRDQETIIARHGAEKKTDLRGESGIGKLKVSTGRDVRTVALEMLLNPQVEFAEPNFLIAKDDTARLLSSAITWDTKQISIIRIRFLMATTAAIRLPILQPSLTAIASHRLRDTTLTLVL